MASTSFKKFTYNDKMNTYVKRILINDKTYEVSVLGTEWNNSTRRIVNNLLNKKDILTVLW